MRPHVRNALAVGLLLLFGSVPKAHAQGFIIDRTHRLPVARSFEVREVTIDAQIREQVAEVRVAQTFHNPGSFQVEAEYLFPIPDEGGIQNFVLMVDGKEIPGRLLPKDEARRVYEQIVRTQRDPALLEYMGRGLFRTSVFPIPPGADRKVTLRYTQLCRRDHDVVEFTYPFATQKFTTKPIQRLDLKASIRSRDPIKSVYCPTHSVATERSGDDEATVRLEEHDVIPTADFRLVYTLARGALGASVLSVRSNDSEDGYFLLLASPEVKRDDDGPPRSKSVVFVLDHSGSMTGTKLEQAKNALLFVLNNLREGDTFNIVVYDDRVESYRRELQSYTKDCRKEAERFVRNIEAGGSTDINAALQSALHMLHDTSRPSYVLFLTDGLPTAGTTNEMAIADNARKANQARARLFAFGVGYDVNARLLDRLSGGNSGVSEYVRPDEDIEAHVSRFYGKLTSPVLSDIAITLEGIDVNRTYPRDIPDLFEGGQLVWVGRYKQSGRTTVRLAGKVGGERRSFEFPAELADADRGGGYDFVEKLWAIRRIGFLIDQIDLHGQNKELTDELVALSTKYGILTPYTSFLADERVPLHAKMDNYRRAADSLQQLAEVKGLSGVEQRAVKGSYLHGQQSGEAENLNRYDLALQADKPGAAPGMPQGQNVTRRGQLAQAGAGGQTQAGQNQSGMGRQSGAVGNFPRAQAHFRNPMGSMMGGGFGAPAAASAPASPAQVQDLAKAVTFKDAQGRDVLATTVRKVGGKTFFRRGDRWIDSTVTPDQEAKAIAIEQFSDTFFELARNQSAELNQYLAFDEPVTVKLGNKVYRIERKKS